MIAHSDMIECMHLYDIRLEADSTEDVLMLENAVAGKLGNGHEHSQPESLSSAMSAFATEQLAVFGGLMRRLSTRKPPAGVANLVANKNVAKERDRLLGDGGSDTGKSKMSYSLKGSKKSPKKKAEAKQSSDLSLALSTTESSTKKVIGTPTSLEISSPVRNITVESRQAPATPSSENTATSTVLTATERRATQRRREWSRHRSDIKRLDATLGSDDELALSPAGNSGKSQEDMNTHSHLEHYAVAGPSNRRLLSPTAAPNLDSLVTDYDRKMSLHYDDEDDEIQKIGGTGLYGGYEDESEMIEIESAIVEEEYNRMIQNRALQQHYNGRGGDSSSHGHSYSSSHHKHGGGGSTSNSTSIAARLNDIQAFVALEQVKTECRQTHLLQWKSFVKKLGAQITSLSIGALNSVDQIVIDILMKYCEVLEELRISNEIDILSYMTYLKDSVKRIHINCEHGVGEY